MSEQYPLIMTEEYWANSQLSIARYYGHIRFMGHEYVIVNKDISWDKIADAMEFANKVISENHTVSRSMMSRDDPDIEKIRVKRILSDSGLF